MALEDFDGNGSKREIIRQEMLDLLKDAASADAIADAMWPSIYAKQRAQEQKEADNRLWPVILKDGEEVTADSDGTEIWGGPSRFPRINFLPPATVFIHDQYNKNQVDVRAGGGGTDCMFDWIVSECWAAEVTAGRGAEGQAFTSLTGCTFYVTSLVQYAWDGIGDGAAAGLKEASGAQVCYICPGDAGPLTISDDTANSGLGVRFIGSGEASRIEASSTGTGDAGTALRVSGGLNRDLTFQMLAIGREALTRAFNLTDGSDVEFLDCVIGHATGYPPLASDASGQAVRGFRTKFLVNGASQYSLDMNGNNNDSRFIDCEFDDRVRPGTETYFINCRFNTGQSFIGIDARNDADVWAVGCMFRNSGGSFTSYISCDGTTNSSHIHVMDCWSNVGATQAILIADGYLTNEAADDAAHQISGNRWKCAVGLAQSGTDTLYHINYTSNSHFNTLGTAFAFVTGRFANCTFEANGPALGYVSFTAASGINRVNGVQVGSGAPTHTASESQEYWDLTANTEYKNTDGGTTWTVTGVAGSGAAAPSPHAFVGTHHTGDDDYTQTPNVLGLGVSTGDIKVYSDAGITLVGEWDGATGAMGLGGGVVTDAYVSLAPTFAPTGVTETAMTYLAGTLDISGGGLGNPHRGLYVVPALTRTDGPATVTGQVRALQSGLALYDNSSGVTYADVAAWDMTIALFETANITTLRGAQFRNPGIAGSGSIGTYYAIDIPTLTAATLNIGIRNLATMRQVGVLTVGSDAAANAMAVADFVSTDKGLLIPRLATASRPAGVNGLIYYDSTTNKFVAYENGAYTNMIGGGGGDVATDAIWDALGDTVYGTGADTAAKLTGNVTTTKKFLRQTGDGVNSAAPAWDTIADSDVPSTHAGSAHHAAVTAGSGIGVAGQIVSLGDLTADWTQAGAFDINSSGKLKGTSVQASGLTGATAATRYVGATASGAPASGTFAVGDYIIDQTGKIYVCTIAGTPGTWTDVAGAGGTHNLVSASHDGEQDYTNALYLGELRLGINGTSGDLSIYSDAGTTLVFAVDAATGHTAIGGAVSPNKTYSVTDTLSSSVGTGFYGNITYTSTTPSAFVFGTDHILQTAPTSTIATIVGNNIDIDLESTTAGTNVIGFLIDLETVAGSGTPTSFKAYTATATAYDGGIPTTTYVYHAGAIGTGATTSYGLYLPAQGGTAARSFIADALVLGTDAAPPSGTKLSVTGGDVSILNDNLLKLYDTGSSNYIGLRADSARTTDLTYILPATDPTVGQVLSASAPSAGVVTLSWADDATGAGVVATDTIWDAAGDLAVGTGADTAAVLSKPSPTEVANTTPSSFTNWASQAGNARKTLMFDSATGTMEWDYLTAIDVLTPAQVLTFTCTPTGGTSSVGLVASSGTDDLTFAMTYQGTPSAASIDIQSETYAGNPEVNVGDYPIAVPSAYTALNTGTTPPSLPINRGTAVAESVTFRVTATVDGQSKTKDVTVTYYNLRLWGISTNTAIDTDAEIDTFYGAQSSEVSSSRVKTFTVTAGASEYIYYIIRTALGTPTFTVGGFEGGFSKVGSAISFSNTRGFTENYDVWRSDLANLGSTTVVVT